MSEASESREKHGSHAVTEGVRVSVLPVYLPEQSDPDEPRHVFGYHIDIYNGSETSIRVLSRFWAIIDAHGSLHEVEGEGVVGLQPTIAPGETFHYGSYCPLRTRWGTMEGHYVAVREDGRIVLLKIARFYLATPSEA